MVSLDEHPEQVMRNAETLGLNLRQHLDSGAIQFFYDCPRELELDVHFARITRTIEAHQIERLIVDGMTSYTSALEDEQQYREFFHALVTYSKDHLMTTFLSYENPELFGVNQFMPDFPVSSIVDNIVLLNFVELGNTLHRAITVAKARGSANQFVTREFTIGPGGITLVPEDAAMALPVLPFQNYYGLLSRAPTRLSPALPRGPLTSDTHGRPVAGQEGVSPTGGRHVRAATARTARAETTPRRRPSGVTVSPALRAALFDPESWHESLEAYAHTTNLAVVLADAAGRQLGPCLNPRPTWQSVARPPRRQRPQARDTPGVPSSWCRTPPAPACGTPWRGASWSCGAIARGWCISPCRWCWRITPLGRCSPGKCSTSTRSNCCWSMWPRAWG